MSYFDKLFESVNDSHREINGIISESLIDLADLKPGQKLKYRINGQIQYGYYTGPDLTTDEIYVCKEDNLLSDSTISESISISDVLEVLPEVNDEAAKLYTEIDEESDAEKAQKETNRKEAERLRNQAQFDGDKEFYVTGYRAEWGYSVAEGGTYYIERWRPFESTGFDTYDEAKNYIEEIVKELKSDDMYITTGEDWVEAEEKSNYYNHEIYKYFIEKKLDRYSNVDVGHGWDW